MRLVTAGALIIGCTLVPAATGAQSSAPLRFADDEPLSTSIEEGSTSASANVVLVNAGPALDQIDFSIASDDPDAPEVLVLATNGSAVPANGSARIDLIFTSDAALDDLSGHLIAAADGAIAERDLAIDTKNQLPFSINFIIFGSLISAAVLSLARAWTLRNRLDHRLGSPSWEFSKSWASTFTVVGALLGTVLSSLVLPETTERFSKETLAGMNLFFGVAVLFAPLVFGASEKLRPVKKDPADPTSPLEMQPQGSVAGYLTAAAFTLSGVIGQLITIFFLLSEIEAKGALPEDALILVLLLLVIGLVLTLTYAWRTLGWTAEHRASPPPPPGLPEAALAAQAGPPLDSWRLL
jgi:hypothetical protein